MIPPAKSSKGLFGASISKPIARRITQRDGYSAGFYDFATKNTTAQHPDFNIHTDWRMIFLALAPISFETVLLPVELQRFMGPFTLIRGTLPAVKIAQHPPAV